jgi:DNA-binding SARP family transcriptional activator
MIRIKTFGGISIEAERRSLGRAAEQRMPLALLSLLVVARDRGFTRDKIAGYLWPESTDERARNTLKQTLYSLRKDLDEPQLIFTNGAGALHLNRAVCTVDAWVFDDLAENNELAAAADLYHGPFLDGFFLRNSPEFEQWLETTRAHFAGRYAKMLETLAIAANRDHTEALHWWRQLHTVDPLNARVVNEVMHAYARAGDRAGALTVYQGFAERLKLEWEAAPDAALTSFADQIRGQTDTVIPTTSIFTTAPLLLAPPPELPATSSVPATGRRKWSVLAAAFSGVAIIALLVLQRANARDAASAAENWRSTQIPVRVAVFPFKALGVNTDSAIGEAAAALLTTRLDGAAAIHAQSAARRINARPQGKTDLEWYSDVAKRMGVDYFIIGDVTRAGSGVELRLTIHDAGARGELARAHASGAESRFIELIDELALPVLASRAATQSGQLVPTAARSTASVAAFTAFVDGERAFRSGRYGDAITAYQKATDLDSTFALAYYRLSMVSDWAAQGLREADAQRARLLADRLPERERMLVNANQAWEAGAVDSAQKLLRVALQLYPDDAEALYLLGEVILHSGPIVGQRADASREYFARAVVREPENTEAIAHLARVEAIDGYAAAVDSLARKIAKLRPAGDRLAAEMEITARMARGQKHVILNELSAKVRPGDQEHLLYMSAWRVAAFTGNVTAGRNAAQDIIARSHDHQTIILARCRLAEYAINDGRVADAIRALSDQRIPGDWGLAMRAYMAALPWANTEQATLRAYADSLSKWQPAAISMAGVLADANGVTTMFIDYPKALVALALKDTAAARVYASRLHKIPDSLAVVLGAGLGSAIEAELAWRHGDTKTAQSLFLRSVAISPLRYRLGTFGGFALTRFRHAQLLEQLGKKAEAARWYESLHGGDSAGEPAFWTRAAFQY